MILDDYYRSTSRVHYYKKVAVRREVYEIGKIVVENTSFNTNNSPSDPNRFVYRIIDLEAGGKIKVTGNPGNFVFNQGDYICSHHFLPHFTTRPGIELPFDDIELGESGLKKVATAVKAAGVLAHEGEKRTKLRRRRKRAEAVFAVVRTGHCCREILNDLSCNYLLGAYIC